MLKGISVQRVYNPEVNGARAGSAGGSGAPVYGEPGYNAGREVAKQALGLGEQLLGIVAREYKETQIGLADEALLGVDEKFQQWRTAYQAEHQGKLGISAQADFAAKYDELAKAAIKDFGHLDEGAGELLRKRLLEHGLMALRDGGSFQQRQRDAWQASQLESQIAWFERHVDEDPLDTEAISYEAGNLLQSWRAKNPGRDSGALEARLGKLVNEKRIEALMADDSRLEDAEALLRNMKTVAGGPKQGSKSERALAGYNFGFVKNTEGKFNRYASRQDGLLAMAERVLRYQNSPERGWHADSLRKFAHIYAPGKDGNDADQYARDLGQWLGINPDAKVDFRNPELLAAMVMNIPRKEHGNFVQIGRDEAMAAARAALAGEKPKTDGAIASSGRGYGGALGDLAISPAKRQMYLNRIEQRKKERAEKQELETVGRWFDDTAGMEGPLRAADLYGRLELVEDVEARGRMERLVNDQLHHDDRLAKVEQDRAAMALLREIQDRNLQPFQANIMLNQSGASPEIRKKVYDTLFGEREKETIQKRQKLYEGRILIDSGLLASIEEREQYAFNHQLTTPMTHQLLNYGGQMENISQTEFNNEVFAFMADAKIRTPKMPPNFYHMVVDQLPKGKVASKNDIQRAIATMFLQGRFDDGKQGRWLDAVWQNRQSAWKPEVRDEEVPALDDLLKRRNLPATAKNRMLIKQLKNGIQPQAEFDR